mmetsp:Transcript_16897/g.33011  ORF Transcript_16897/g.33011 Transcript_16897/m.33011 type:complete len:986 (-) Transcript_16897:134-3091(-)
MALSSDDELASLLSALCSAEPQVRTAAEQALAAGQLQPGFAGRLIVYAVAGHTTPECLPMQQMCLTVLRRLTSPETWVKLSMDDHVILRQKLLGALADQTGGIRRLAHACVANISASGGPWPELLSQLIAAISAGTEHEATCCVGCAVVLFEECSAEVALSLGPLQEPLLRLAANDAAPPQLRCQCLQAHLAAVSATLVSCDDAGPVLHGVVSGLPAWLAVHAKLCAGQEGWDDTTRVACAFAAIRTATSLTRLPPLEAALAAPLEALMRPACLLVQQLETAYEQAVIRTDDGGASEEEGGVGQLVTQLMELLQAMLLRPKLRTLLKTRVKSLLQLLVPFMRITEAQAKAWRADPNEFLAHEEDDFVRGCAIRLSGESLIGELLGHLRRESGRALATLTADLLNRAAGNAANEWKLVEVALFIFGNVAGEVQPKSLQRGEFAELVPVALEVACRLCAESSTPEFLRARAFAVLRRLGDVVCIHAKGDLPTLLKACASAIAPGEPLVVRVCACRSFCRFLTACDDSSLKESLLLEHGVLASLGALMQAADEELLHLTLESLCLIVKQCPGAMVSVEASLAALILEIWRRCAADPMVHLQVLDLVSCATGSDARLQQSLEERLLPAVTVDLQPGVDLHLTSSAVELYGVLIKRTSIPFGPQVWACAELLMAAVMRCTESGLLQNACEVLCSLIRRSPTQLSGQLEALLRCMERLLGHDLDDDACLYVGPLASLVLGQYGSLIPVQLTMGLLQALVTRLARAERPYLQQELVVVFARLLHQDQANVLIALAGMQVPCSFGGVAARSGLELLMSTWLSSAKEIRAKKARTITVSALCRLHERCREDANLRDMLINGHALQDQLLTTIVAGLEFENERCQKLKDSECLDCVESDDADDDEEDCEDEFGEGGGRGFGKLLSELVDLDDDDLSDVSGDEGGTAQEPDDPLLKLDLQATVAQYLASDCVVASMPPELAPRAAAAVKETTRGLP